MKIISLNTWQGERAEALEQYLLEQKSTTDLFLFQEANGNFDVLRKKIFSKFRSMTTRKADDAYDDEWCLTTLFGPEVELIAAGDFFASRPEQGSGLWTKLRYQNEEYTICNIHGASIPHEKVDCPARIAQSEEIIAFLKNQTGTKIVMGDFNLFPDTKSVKMFEEAGYRNLIGDFQIDTTRNELAWAKYPDNKHLFADYCFVSDDIEVRDFQVPKNEISDHLPMELTIV